MERMNNFRGRKVGWRGGTLAAFLLSAATMRGLAQGSRTCSDSPGHPEPFGPTLADSGVTFRGTFSADGREFWFFRKVSADPHAEDYRIFVSRRQEAGWSAPERVDLGGDYSDLYPARSPDGRWLAFTSYRRMPGDTLAKPNAGLWAAEHAADGGWKPPIPLTAATRIGAYQSQPVFGRDGRLYFRRTSPDWDTTTNLVTALFGAPTAYDPAERWMRWRDDLQGCGGAVRRRTGRWSCWRSRRGCRASAAASPPISGSADIAAARGKLPCPSPRESTRNTDGRTSRR